MPLFRIQARGKLYGVIGTQTWPDNVTARIRVEEPPCSFFCSRPKPENFLDILIEHDGKARQLILHLDQGAAEEALEDLFAQLETAEEVVERDAPVREDKQEACPCGPADIAPEKEDEEEEEEEEEEEDDEEDEDSLQLSEDKGEFKATE